MKFQKNDGRRTFGFDDFSKLALFTRFFICFGSMRINCVSIWTGIERWRTPNTLFIGLPTVLEAKIKRTQIKLHIDYIWIKIRI